MRTLKFAFEFCPSPSMVVVHTSCKLPVFTNYLGPKANDEPAGELLREALGRIDGVILEYCHGENYSLVVCRAAVHNWDDILPAVMTSLMQCLGYDHAERVSLYPTPCQVFKQLPLEQPLADTADSVEENDDSVEKSE